MRKRGCYGSRTEVHWETNGYTTESYDDARVAILSRPRLRLKDRVYRLNEIFDTYAWWWYWDIKHDAEVMQLLSVSGIAAFDADIDKYVTNLVASKARLDAVWCQYIESLKVISGVRESVFHLIGDVGICESYVDE